MKFYKIIFLLTIALLSLASCKKDTKSGNMTPVTDQEGVFLDYPVKDLGKIPRDVPLHTSLVITLSLIHI